MEQAGMFIAVIKLKVKVLGSFSEHISKFHISRSCCGKRAKSLKSQKGEMRKKLKITIHYPRKWIVTQGGGARPKEGNR